MGRKGKKAPTRATSSSPSSSSGSPTASNGSCAARSVSRERVGNYDLSGLSREWDNHPVIRDRIRDGHHLCRHLDETTQQEMDAYVECSMEDARVNKFVLSPIMVLMKSNDLLLPNLDRLIQSIDLLYHTARKPQSLEHSYQQAWSIRRLIQQVKSHLYKDFPPQDCKSGTTLCMCMFLMFHDFLYIYMYMPCIYIYCSVGFFDILLQHLHQLDQLLKFYRLYITYMIQ